MKKFISLVLSTTMCLSLMACGGNSDDSQQTEMENTESQEETQTVEVDEGIFDVEITVPADFLEEGTTQDDLDVVTRSLDLVLSERGNQIHGVDTMSYALKRIQMYSRCKNCEEENEEVKGLDNGAPSRDAVFTP